MKNLIRLLCMSLVLTVCGVGQLVNAESEIMPCGSMIPCDRSFKEIDYILFNRYEVLGGTGIFLPPNDSESASYGVNYSISNGVNASLFTVLGLDFDFTVSVSASKTRTVTNSTGRVCEIKKYRVYDLVKYVEGSYDGYGSCYTSKHSARRYTGYMIGCL